MLWFRRKKAVILEHEAQEKRSTVEISYAKRITTRKLNEINEANTRLKRLIDADGITLNIHIATGGGRGR